MRVYNYTMAGTGADDAPWEVSGQLSIDDPHEFTRTCNELARDAFLGLTSGRATFGHPGVGCLGPYRVTKFSFEQTS